MTGQLIKQRGGERVGLLSDVCSFVRSFIRSFVLSFNRFDLIRFASNLDLDFYACLFLLSHGQRGIRYLI